MTELRPYQQRSVNAVLEAWRDGAKRVLLVSPTGSGKSRMCAEVTAREGGSSRWVVHRRELAEQAPGDAITVQKMISSGGRPEADVLVIDEAHHFCEGAPEFFRAVNGYGKVLGATATPCRSDGAALGSMFDHMVVAANYSELIADGWLVPCRAFRPKEEIAGVAEDPASAWRRLAGNQQGFAFFSRVEQAKKFVHALRDRDDLFARSRAAAVWGEMPEEERINALSSFRRGALRCLANAQLLTEGVDVPQASVCLLATGCDHVGSFLQRVGRVLRPAPEKTSALLIDLSGASHRFGLPTDDREYSLDGRPIRSKVEALRVCQKCGCTYPTADGACPSCGFLPSPPPVRLNVLHMDLEEVISSPDATPKQKKIARALQNKWGDATRDELMDEFHRLRDLAVAKGYRRGWAFWQFKLRTGIDLKDARNR